MPRRVRERDVLRLEVAMDHIHLRQVTETEKDLLCYLAQQDQVRHREAGLLLPKGVQVDVEELEDDDVVAAKEEAVVHLDDPMLIRVFNGKSGEELGLVLCHLRVFPLVSTNLQSNSPAIFLHVNAINDLPESSRVDRFVRNVSIGDLLASHHLIVAIARSYLAFAFDSHRANRVNEIKALHLESFKSSELVFIVRKRLWHGQTPQNLRSRLHLGRCRKARTRV